LSEKDITRFLQILGLSKREIQVYMFLAKSGVQSTSFVAKRLKMERVQAYRTFKKLQEKGFIEATLERPTRFTIVPFENLALSSSRILVAYSMLLFLNPNFLTHYRH